MLSHVVMWIVVRHKKDCPLTHYEDADFNTDVAIKLRYGCNIVTFSEICYARWCSSLVLLPYIRYNLQSTSTTLINTFLQIRFTCTSIKLWYLRRRLQAFVEKVPARQEIFEYTSLVKLILIVSFIYSIFWLSGDFEGNDFLRPASAKKYVTFQQYARSVRSDAADIARHANRCFVGQLRSCSCFTLFGALLTQTRNPSINKFMLQATKECRLVGDTK